MNKKENETGCKLVVCGKEIECVVTNVIMTRNGDGEIYHARIRAPHTIGTPLPCTASNKTLLEKEWDSILVDIDREIYEKMMEKG